MPGLLTPLEIQTLNNLAARHDAEMPDLLRYHRHYDLEQPLAYMHPELWTEVADRIKPVLIAWPQVVVDSVEERLDVEGFRYGTEAKDDEQLREWWQANNLDEGAPQEHLEAILGGRGYVTVGTRSDEKDTPLFCVESALQMTADFDPQTRKVRAALKRWTDGTDRFATLRMPYGRISLASSGNGRWEVTDRDDHKLGDCLVVPFINRGRIYRLDRGGRVAAPGRSELAPVLPLSDAACKIATDMMVAAESVAVPGRYLFGVSQDEFVDAAGNQVSPWKTVLGKLLANEADPDDVKAGQWPSADLANFHNTLNSLAQITAAIAALPGHYLGLTTDNPASADAIRSNEARLVKRAERKQTSFGESWERVMALGQLVTTGDVDPKIRTLETRWRDAATPTRAQQADATVKLKTANIIPTPQAREDLGYTTGQIERMEEWDRQAAGRVMGGDVAALLTGPKPQPVAPPFSDAGA